MAESDASGGHDGHTVVIPTWPDVIVRLARENGLSCRCGPEYTERRLIAPDCQYHDFFGFVEDLLALPVEQRMEAMGMRRSGHEYVPKADPLDPEQEQDWWRCATCGGYDTSSAHRPTYEPADYPTWGRPADA